MNHSTTLNIIIMEDNVENLYGREAFEKIRELVIKGKSCLFCTGIKTGKAFATRPMSVQQVDDEGSLWFLSAADSHKNQEIESDNHVQLLFQGSAYAGFLTLYGRAFISKDRAKAQELWDPMLKSWFTEGADDPRISIIKVEAADGYYWDTKHAMVVGLVKRLVGAAIGKKVDDSIEGKIDLG